MRGDDTRRGLASSLSDAALWRAGRGIELAEDEVERFLDLAGYADGRLDPDDRERVEEWLATDPAATDDVAAARLLGASTAQLAAAPEWTIARACALVDGGAVPQGNIIPFAPRYRRSPSLHRMGRWGSLVAAIAVASWLGFTLGVDTSRSLAQIDQAGETGFLGDLLNPSTDLTRDPTGGAQT